MVEEERKVVELEEIEMIVVLEKMLEVSEEELWKVVEVEM